MGLSNALSGGIMLFAMTYVIFSFSGVMDSTASFTEVSSEVSDKQNKLLKTSIELFLYEPSIGDSIVEFYITNTDLEKLWDFDKFDVIITYDSAGLTYTETITYVSSCPPVAGEWCITAWYEDRIDPLILNTSESIDMRAAISNNLQNNRDLIVIVSTPNGVVATASTVV